MEKIRLAISWNASCGGCDEAIVDIEEHLLSVAEKVEFVLWPCAMDFKYHQIEQMADDSIDVALINGGIQNTDQQHIVKLLRQKSKIVVAFGSCAALGGIPGLINLSNRDALMNTVYQTGCTVVNPEKKIPSTNTMINGHELTLPEIFDTLYMLSDVIEVDYALPGCPPSAKLIMQSLQAILEQKLPAKGSVLLPDKSLCASCERNDSKPDSLLITKIKRIHQIVADPNVCFLAQDVLCMGPATRDGCESACIQGNMPCSGCYGPTAGADQGAQMIGSLGSMMASDNEQNLNAALDSLHDPAGTFYRYSLASSLLGRKRM